MGILSPLLCQFGRHEPLRRNVEWNGRAYTGRCRHCGREIVRKSHRRWRSAAQ